MAEGLRHDVPGRVGGCSQKKMLVNLRQSSLRIFLRIAPELCFYTETQRCKLPASPSRHRGYSRRIWCFLSRSIHGFRYDSRFSRPWILILWFCLLLYRVSSTSSGKCLTDVSDEHAVAIFMIKFWRWSKFLVSIWALKRGCRFIGITKDNDTEFHVCGRSG